MFFKNITNLTNPKPTSVNVYIKLYLLKNVLTKMAHSSFCLISVHTNCAEDLDTSLLKKRGSSVKPFDCPSLMTYCEPFSRSKVNRAKLPFIIHETFQRNASIFLASLI